MTTITRYVEEQHPFGLPAEALPGSPPPGIMWVFLHEGKVVGVNFLCPCGCGQETYTPVTDATKGEAKQQHHWLFSRGPNGPTLSPSVRRLSGCKAHFNITDGSVITHGDSGK